MTEPPPLLLVDTNVVSYVFNGDLIADFYLDKMRGKRLMISFQTLEELWFGAANAGWGARRRSELAQHLEAYEIVWPNQELASISAELRAERKSAGRELKSADAWIAATALLLGCPIASHDGDFVDIPNLTLIRGPSA